MREIPRKLMVPPSEPAEVHEPYRLAAVVTAAEGRARDAPAGSAPTKTEDQRRIRPCSAWAALRMIHFNC